VIREPSTLLKEACCGNLGDVIPRMRSCTRFSAAARGVVDSSCPQKKSFCLVPPRTSGYGRYRQAAGAMLDDYAARERARVGKVRSSRGTEGLQTLRWREPDSNRWSHPLLSTRPMPYALEVRFADGGLGPADLITKPSSILPASGHGNVNRADRARSLAIAAPCRSRGSRLFSFCP
jgi:hypothetical protein